ncbi:hypothetical protein [Streptomyces lasiicapitis]|uniref:hypothetical protein n=1 Tax=Streptomyces lasiicapitis TaxID=1923961 RepID=UPI0036791C03
MTTTTEIAARHGYTGPLVCQGCGTTERLHFGSWFDPATGESGDFLQCCACGIKAGDPADLHGDCEPDTDEPEEEPGLDAGPTRIFRCTDGWTMNPELGVEACTTNFHREQDGRPACTAPAVWKVVEEHVSADGFPMLTIGFYCDADLPAEHTAHGEAA